MKTWIGFTLAIASSAMLANGAAAHGGAYRGPGDTVPTPSGGSTGGGPVTPGTGGPSGPSGGPPTPGSANPGGAFGAPGVGVGPTTGGGDGGSDPTQWQFWWELNKDPYLNLRAHLYAEGVLTGSDGYFLAPGEVRESRADLRPGPQIVHERVVPSLLRALDNETQGDVVTGAMLALAKIGEARGEDGRAEIARHVLPHLLSSNQEIAETAALALGILGDDANVALLVDLLAGDRSALSDAGVHFTSDVPERTRAFAAFGLALLGRGATDAARVEIVGALVRTLEKPGLDLRKRDVPVACVLGIGLVPLPGDDDGLPSEGRETTRPRSVDSRQKQVLWLLSFFGNTRNEALVRAQVPRSMAKLVGDLPSEHWLKERVARTLLGAVAEFSKESDWVKQASTLALGQVGDADLDALDVEIRAALEAVPERAREPQAKRFALIALGQVAGRRGDFGADGFAALESKRCSRSFLLERFTKGQQSERCWAALALGVMEHAALKNRGPSSSDVRATVRAVLADATAPDVIGACAIALGMMDDAEADGLLQEKLDATADPEARGYVALALGMLGETASIAEIEAVVERSKYSPALLRQAAIALGLLGDDEAVPKLLDMLSKAQGLSSQAAIASALGTIGDVRSLDPLVGLLNDQQKTAGARGFAAAALGMIADKESLPWRASISVDLDYRANTETLSTPEFGTGVLDIL